MFGSLTVALSLPEIAVAVRQEFVHCLRMLSLT